ncbi:ras-related protein Rab21 [Trypanosoma grayi]|uniref:ras-related protein Rab21 n=1 Tax=Trypanosoma grayi TaxID=71804 RepID=UPI0004F450D7|nr:ras-related protein Rab21 [Trypanosoma grayi]KEG07602.1 ras-related protein Rab21 [Trypanosoma grayi]
MSARYVKMKIVMLGEGRVGKTSLLQRFINDSFDDDCESTTKASMYANVKISVSHDVTAELSIWDTAGQERYHALGPIYYRDAHGAVLVYDITDYESFLKVKVWLKELQQVVGNQNISVVIVGNKIDLERQRCVPLKEAEEWAHRQNARHYSVSAKLGLHAVEPFEGIAVDVATKIVETDQTLHQITRNKVDGMTIKMPIGLGASPPKSRGVRVKLDEAPEEDRSAVERHCVC